MNGRSQLGSSNAVGRSIGARKDAFRAELQLHTEVTVNTKEGLGKEVANDASSRELARRMIDGTTYGYEDITDQKKDAV
jgi:hypothetical protein